MWINIPRCSQYPGSMVSLAGDERVSTAERGLVLSSSLAVLHLEVWSAVHGMSE